MSKFYSIPGTRIHQKDEHSTKVLLPPLDANPNLKEWLDSRKATSHSTVGLSPGERASFRGDAAIVRHEERDQHTGVVEQVVQRSDANGSGTYINKWVPGDGPRDIVLSGSKRSFD